MRVFLVLACVMVQLHCWGGGFDFAGDLHVPRLFLLKQKGFSPKVVYDVGAHKGDWSQGVSRVFPSSSFYLFEANRDHKPFLERKGFPFFMVLLGKDNEDVIFYQNGSSGDSFLRETTRHYQQGKCAEIPMRTQSLQSLVKHEGIPLPDLIKMDVQGAEKLIIEGAKEVIQHAEVVILEANFLQYNEGAPLLYDLMKIMDELGFVARDILENHYLPNGELIQSDFLWLKKDSPFVGIIF